MAPQPADGNAIKISILLPYYNEKATAESCLTEIRQAMAGRNDYEILVIDDGSTEIDIPALERLADRVVRHPQNRGYGAAIKTGIRNSRGEVLVILDADGTYPPDAIPRLLERLEGGCDMVVGSRQDYPASRRNLGPWHRRLAKRLLVLTANYLAETRIPDLNSGLRAFRRADAARFLSLIPNGFSLTTTLTLAYISEGLMIDYVPIHYRGRAGAERSKIRPFHDTLSILLTIIRTVTFFRPLKVFLPIALALGAVGLTVLIYGVVAHNILDGTISVLLVSAVQMFVLGLLADVVARSRR
jgi:glycosyltransferase involved in cell wall biosynthesis